jgi:DNA-directed RNA polymerase subunit RPC12/RpoP
MKRFIFFITLLLACLLFVSPALAQTDPGLQLGLSRDFGYGGFGNDIQGLFSMRASGPDDLQRVAFFIDQASIGKDTEAPFRIQFNTDNFPLGIHTLYAVGYTASGQELRSNEIVVDFVSAGEGWNAGMRIVIPLLAVVFGFIVLSYGLTYFAGRNKPAPAPGEARHYGLPGGAICPRCQRPFPLNWMSLNMGLHKLDRCPYCGRWGLVRPRSINELRQAEAAELIAAQQANQVNPQNSEDQLKKDLDNSRFSP